MPLPEPILDDLRFQRDLVDQARKRIIQYCPEWTDYNLSDPGITLIELFAWMTEMITYRLNRVPEKNYIRFLDMLGIQLQPADSARTQLTFWLSAPLPLTEDDNTIVTIPRGTEVATRRTQDEDEIIFTTDEKLTIISPQLIQIRNSEEITKNHLPRFGLDTFYPFDRTQPKTGDTFYLGFDEEHDISGHILRLSFQCEETQAVGIRREDPPLVWECSMGNDEWKEIVPSTLPGEKDTTGGLNNPNGSVFLYLPLDLASNVVHGHSAFWIRCRFEPRRPEQGRYTESPRIVSLNAYSSGAVTTATHARIVENELIGVSTGDAGQRFTLNNAPVLPLQAGETLEVQEEGFGDIGFIKWEAVEDFSNSDKHDRHFTIDLSSGVINFGPAIRQPDGTTRQYGRIPEIRRNIRFARYRHGGGSTGNVPTNKLQEMKTSIPYVDRVSNLVRAQGGKDPESLEEAKMRARRELRSQQRAVTAEDYEMLCLRSSAEIARVKCQSPGKSPTAPQAGVVELLIVPAAHDALKAGDLSGLHVDISMRARLSRYLDRYRLLTTNLLIKEPKYIGVQVSAEIVASPFSDPAIVQKRIIDKLNNYLSPLALPNPNNQNNIYSNGRPKEWQFGKDVFLLEIDSLLRKVEGVMHVWNITLNYRNIIPETEKNLANGKSDPPKLTTLSVEERKITIPGDTLVCSLPHNIKMIEEDEEEK